MRNAIFIYFIVKWRNNGFEQKNAAILNNKVNTFVNKE